MWWVWLIVAPLILAAYLCVFESPLWQHQDLDPDADNASPMEIP